MLKEKLRSQILGGSLQDFKTHLSCLLYTSDAADE